MGNIAQWGRRSPIGRPSANRGISIVGVEYGSGSVAGTVQTIILLGFKGMEDGGARAHIVTPQREWGRGYRTTVMIRKKLV